MRSLILLLAYGLLAGCSVQPRTELPTGGSSLAAAEELINAFYSFDPAPLRSAMASAPSSIPELRKLAEHLGREVHHMRARVELLARRTVADRLAAWLALNGGALPARGQWRIVAEDIGVAPESFYRELQRRRRSLL